jgi:arylsulfatase A-like enzyme
MAKKTNVILMGIDSLRRDRMSSYGYRRLTTPHLDKFAQGGILFEQHFSPSIPTTPAYASMLTGMDCFGTDVVALRHEGGLGKHVKTLAELLEEHGYNTTCVGFTGNPSSRGFQNYLDYEAWLPDSTGKCTKAENLNEVAIPELKRLAAEDKPFLLFLRHMDPHSPYLPPQPFERIFYGGNERDPDNKSMEPVYNFKPFADFLKSWIPKGVTDQEFVDAQYDGAVAYMDSCIQNILQTVEALGIEDETLIVITADHGETLYEHDCYFDHHGLYDCTLVVPLILKLPGKVPAGKRVNDVTLISDIMPTMLALMDIPFDKELDGRSLVPLMEGQSIPKESEFYISECTWMRKHGWRTSEWKLIRSLEPDFHSKPEVELYNLIKDAGENVNLAEKEPEIVELLTKRMEAHIQKREQETGRVNPIYTNLNWHGKGGGPFKSSEQAYNTLHIDDVFSARRLQARNKAAEEMKQVKESK